MKIIVTKTGSIWHGTVEGHPEIDERGLTEEIARRKVEQRLAKRIEEDPSFTSRVAVGIRDAVKLRRGRKDGSVRK